MIDFCFWPANKLRRRRRPNRLTRLSRLHVAMSTQMNNSQPMQLQVPPGVFPGDVFNGMCSRVALGAFFSA